MRGAARAARDGPQLEPRRIPHARPPATPRAGRRRARAAKSYTPFRRPAANIPAGNSSGTNCCSSSENSRRAARLQQQLCRGGPAHAHQYGIALDPPRACPSSCARRGQRRDRARQCAHPAVRTREWLRRAREPSRDRDAERCACRLPRCAAVLGPARCRAQIDDGGDVHAARVRDSRQTAYASRLAATITTWRPGRRRSARAAAMRPTPAARRANRCCGTRPAAR